VIVSGTSLDSGHDMASRRRFSFKKRLMVLLQNRYQFSVKTADGSLLKTLMALCQNSRWFFAKTADGCLLKPLMAVC